MALVRVIYIFAELYWPLVVLLFIKRHDNKVIGLFFRGVEGWGRGGGELGVCLLFDVGSLCCLLQSNRAKNCFVGVVCIYAVQ